MDRSRTVLVLVVIGLLSLAAWTYSSGSISTNGAAGGPVTSATSPTTSAPGKTSGSTTTQAATPTTAAAPTTTIVADPKAYAYALFRYWIGRDRDAADKVAVPAVVKQLWIRHVNAGEKFAAQGCQGAAGSTFCTWLSSRRRFVMQVRNATGGLPVLVVALQVSRA